MAGLAAVVVASLTGWVPRYFFGEEFLLFRYADRFNHEVAWQLYFQDNGRIVEALYWSYLYKLVGFNPLLIHALSFVLLLAACILAAKVFAAVWPRTGQPRHLAYVLVFLLFFNWVSLPMAFKVSTDNSRLALIFFFLAGLLLQQWARRGQAAWALASLGVFALSILSYENALLLFPGLLLLAWPLSAGSRRRALQFAGLGLLSWVLAGLLYYFYASQATDLDAMAHPALRASNPLEAATRMLLALPRFIIGLGNAELLGPPWSLALSLAVLAVLGLAAYLLLYTRKQQAHSTLFLAAGLAWFIVFGFLPYAAVGYDAFGRVFSSSIFGLVPLALLVYQLAGKRWVRSVALVGLIIFAASGLLAAAARQQQIVQAEVADNTLYRGLLEIVPAVKADTVFIFFDRPLSISGCGPSLEMLYRQDDLYCSFLSSDLQDYWAIRHHDHLETNRGGNLRQQDNWVLVALDDAGRPYLVEQLSPQRDYGMQITWLSKAPVATISSQIIKEPGPPTPFNQHLFQRQQQMGLP